jgi:hypothetical protein
VSTEALWVSRPFKSRDESRKGPPPGGAVLSVVVADLGRQVLNASGSAMPGVLQVPPAASPGDVRLEAVSSTAVKERTVVAGATMTYAGRPCRVYRSRSTLLSKELIGVPRPSDHVDTCIDSAGLVLDERVVEGARISRERRAVSVEVGTRAAHGNYATTGTRIPPDKGGGSIQAVTLSSKPPGRPFWSLTAPPKGFNHLGRYAVVPPQPYRNLAAISASIDDVFVKGPDVIVIEQGTGKGPLNAPPHGVDVDIARLGRGRLAISAVSSSLVIRPRGGDVYVEVRGTVSPRVLTAVARSLVSEPPGTLHTVAPGPSEEP